MVAVSAAAGLSACVSLFPKAVPAQLYRFGPAVTATDGAVPAGRRVDVALGPVEFTQAAAGDRLLTMTGNEAAYISGARWVTPAEDLFADAVQRSFGNASTVRLVDRRQATASSLMLDLKVETFETRYDNGDKAAPTVSVAVHARIIRFPDRAVIGDRVFQVNQPAGDNRVGAIVPAYDGAVASVLKDLTAWTDQVAASAPAKP
jgi:cholesterol transport system auxiliary component